MREVLVCVMAIMSTVVDDDVCKTTNSTHYEGDLVVELTLKIFGLLVVGTVTPYSFKLKFNYFNCILSENILKR